VYIFALLKQLTTIKRWALQNHSKNKKRRKYAT
jgi:hypothetical protein